MVADPTDPTTLGDFQSGSDDAGDAAPPTGSGGDVGADTGATAVGEATDGSTTGDPDAAATGGDAGGGDDEEAAPPAWTELLSDEASWADDSCPWCLHPAAEFEHSDSGVGCPNCDARIPVESEWYLAGEKIIL